MLPVQPYTKDNPPAPNVEKMISTMMLEGYTANQAYGWTGNAQQESYKDLRPKVRGDGGNAIGIFQWHNVRLGELAKFGIEQDLHVGDVVTQVRFSLVEPGEKKAHKLLQEADTIEQAVDAGIAYTRPSRPERDRRLALANALRDWYEKTSLEALT